MADSEPASTSLINSRNGSACSDIATLGIRSAAFRFSYTFRGAHASQFRKSVSRQTIFRSSSAPHLHSFLLAVGILVLTVFVAILLAIVRRLVIAFLVLIFALFVFDGKLNAEHVARMVAMRRG